MESSNKHNNYGHREQQQLHKRKFNELAIDGQLAADEEEQKLQKPLEKLSKKKCEQQENDALEVCTTGLN
jgi:hypothetical protein